MPEISGPYDSGYIQPIAKIKENISVFSRNMWAHFKIEFLEPIQAGPGSIVEMISIAGATGLAGGATISKRIVPVLQLQEFEMLHVRWTPLDDVEGVIWQLAGQQKFATENMLSRVDMRTQMYDPTLASTTTFIMGQNRDINLEVRNPSAYITHLARFQFFGFRYILSDLVPSTATEAQKNALKQGDITTIKALIGVTTMIYAEGRQS